MMLVAEAGDARLSSSEKVFHEQLNETMTQAV
jgi:hypothetical protein